jgi:hypothetical protein
MHQVNLGFRFMGPKIVWTHCWQGWACSAPMISYEFGLVEFDHRGFWLQIWKQPPSKRLKTWCFRQNAVFHWIAFCVSCEDDVDFCSRKCLWAVCAKMWTTEKPLYLIRGFDLIGGWMQAVENIVDIVAFGLVLLNNQDDLCRILQNIAEHILWIPSFSKLNIAVHALSLKWTILWFVLWGDLMAFCKHQGWKRRQLLFGKTSTILFASEMVWHLGMGGLTKRFTKRPCFGNKTDHCSRGLHTDLLNKQNIDICNSQLPLTMEWKKVFCPYKNANWSHIIMHGVLASFLSGFGKLASTDDTNTNGHSFHSAHIVEWNRGRERTFSSWEAQIFCGSPFDMF